MLGDSCGVNSVECGVRSTGRERDLVQADGEFEKTVVRASDA